MYYNTMLIYFIACIILWSTAAPTEKKIDHTEQLVSDISNLYLSESFSDVDLSDGLSDVDLVVKGKQLSAHRIILASRSEYFRKSFNGIPKKPGRVVLEINEAPLTIFKIFLEYFYTGRMKLSDLKGIDVTELLRISDLFSFSNLTYSLREYLVNNIKLQKKNVIDHTQFLVSDISNLYLSNRFSDVILVVEGEKLPVHRIVLASRSEYFRRAFYGGHKETYQDMMEINEVLVSIFKILLEYIYTGHINFTGLKVEEVLELIRISDLFHVLTLNTSLNEYLKKDIEVDNVCSYFNMTRLYQCTQQEVESLNFIENNALRVLQSEDFLSLSSEDLYEILIRDSFYANEIDIFRAVFRWINENQYDLNPDTQNKVLSAVRYPLMSDEELFEARKTLGSKIADAVQCRNKTSSDKPQFRGQLRQNLNLIGWCQCFPPIDSLAGGTRMIMLQNPSFINYIELMLSDGDGTNPKFYSYYIEVSMDQQHWNTLIDHSNYNCRSTQQLWFHPLIVRYIRFVGTKSTANELFNIRDVNYNTSLNHKVDIINGLVAPKHVLNVAKRYMNASVIKGENSVRDYSLLDYYYESLSRHNEYTWHRLESGGCIVVHLAQPYILGSMRMLLWGGDAQAYSYTIQVSVDNEQWETIVDKSKELTRSWQLLKFEARPIQYIRITGVRSSVRNEFRCVYLEAPARASVV